MDYEKAYNEALERAKSAIKECGDNKGRITMIESIFPELGENEDERIRKTLREIIIDYDPNNEILIKEVGVSQKQFITWLEKQGEQKPTNKVEPKFKVKVADREYNVLETKVSAGVTFYGIEDEPNHIDFIPADDCEIIGGYGIKENGAPYPTKPIMFLEQGERNNIVEQLTAFAVHLQKRGAFCEDLCMDFEHEAQSFIEFREYQNNKEL